MLTRRGVCRGALGTAAAFAARAGYSKLSSVGYERGDPDLLNDPALLSGENAQARSGSGPKLVIPDPDTKFREKLVQTALSFEGVNRWDDSKAKIVEMLAAFGCPFSADTAKGPVYTAFCAAGVGYCGALVYAGGEPVRSAHAILTMRVLDYHNFWPSSAVRNMVQVADAKRRWRSTNDLAGPVMPGWIVCFDWTGSADPKAVDHCGIVIGATEKQLETIEFNTCSGKEGDQRDGGVVACRTRSRNKTVKGFIVTDTRL